MIAHGMKLKTTWQLVINVDTDGRLTSNHLRRFQRRAQELGITENQLMEDLIIREATRTQRKKA